MIARQFAFLLGLCASLANSAQAALPIEHWQTDNGGQVYFVRVDSIPMLDIQLRFRAGSVRDPADKAGLAALTAALLDAGAGSRNEKDLADAFARIGAARSGFASDDSASVRLRTLTDPAKLKSALQLLADMVARPRFSEQALKRERERTIQGLREGDHRPAVLLNRRFYRLAYPDHPYGRQITEASLAKIKRADLVAFHRRRYVASGAIVAIVGAIGRDHAERIASELLGELPAGGDSKPASRPSVTMLQTAIEDHIPHEAEQSHIVVGAPFMARGDPDFFAMLLANRVLGGGSFVSRLYADLRERQGLVYSVGSSFSAMKQPGPFTIRLQTRRSQTAQALQSVRDVLKAFVRDGPTAAELESARANLLGGFPMQLNANRKILGILSSIGFFGLGLDYLDRWPERIAAVSLADVRSALRRRLHPDRMVTVVVGENPFEKGR